MSDAPHYEVFALRYARRDAMRSDHFIGGDAHDGPMAMDYFIWIIRNANRTIIVDTGFTEPVARRRKREYLRCPVDSLALLGIDPAAIHDVVLTHLHYDHVGNFDRFPNASFHLQEAELQFACGRHMRYPFLRHSFEVDDVVGIVKLNFAERVRLYTGPAELCPGVTLHPAPGHSAGLQFVRVDTARGQVVLASDVTHYYEHMQTHRPFTTCVNIADMLESHDRLVAAAPTLQHIVPGHDPLVMQRYPAPRPDLEGIVARLDVPPLE